MNLRSQSARPGLDAGAAAPRPVRLLHVLGYAGALGKRTGITGAERVVQLLLDGLDKRRFEQYVVYPESGALFHLFRDRTPARLGLEPRRRYDRAYVAALVRFTGAHGIHVVLSHGQRYDFLCALASRRTRVPHVVVRAVALADEAMGNLRKAIYGLVDAWTLRACTGIVAVSQASKRRMQRTQALRNERITVIPNGVHLRPITAPEREAARRALGVHSDAVLIGGVGQLIRRKGFDVLVEALALLGPQAVGVQLVAGILGEGPERRNLHDLARAKGLRLLLPGYVPDPYPTMAGFDVAVLPSRAEGMPLAVLESMALGVATVATTVAGTAELIEDGASGLLVPADDPAELARALGRLVADPELRRRLGAAGAQRVREHFSLEAMLRGFEVYLSSLAASQSPAVSSPRSGASS